MADPSIPYTIAAPDDDPAGLRNYLTLQGGNPDDFYATQGVQAAAPSPNQPAAAPTPAPVAAQPVERAQPAPYEVGPPPEYHSPDDDLYKQTLSKRAVDAAPPNAKETNPRWYDRVLGGFTSGAMAFGGVPGAVEAGQGVTNRRYNDAMDKRKVALDADDTQIQNIRQERQDAAQQYERELSGYNANLSRVRNQQQQNNSDRSFNERQTNDKFTQNARRQELDRQQEDLDYKVKHGDATEAETKRYHDNEIELSKTRTGIEQQNANTNATRERREADATNPRGKSGLLTKQVAIKEKYDDQMDKLELGDPKSSDPDEALGFKQKFQKLQGSDRNPDGNPWAPGEKEAVLAGLKQQNRDHKNRIMQHLHDDLSTVGGDSQLVQYDEEGNVVKQPTQAQAAPPQQGQQPQQAAAPPQTSQQQPASTAGAVRDTVTNPVAPTPRQATPPVQSKPGAQQNRKTAPPVVKVKGGTVTVGTPVIFNGKKGVVVGFNAQGKPIVK